MTTFNIPAGFVLVPLEPTKAMIDAGYDAENNDGKTMLRAAWRYMLAAAPPVDAVDSTPVVQRWSHDDGGRPMHDMFGPWVKWEDARSLSAPPVDAVVGEPVAPDALLSWANKLDPFTRSTYPDNLTLGCIAKELRLLATPAVSRAEGLEPVVWGWAIVNKDGDEVETRARLGNYYSEKNHEFDQFDLRDLDYADRENQGWAPHRIVTLYAAPVAPTAPAEPSAGEAQS